jgi:hypothetical protein
MTLPIRPVFVALALAITGASGVALWWLLRREARTTLLCLALVASVGLSLRLFYTTDFPTGLNEDEPKVLYWAGKAIKEDAPLAESNISVPILMHALFQGQLIPILGPGRWAIRTYNLVGGVLAIPAAFAVARALQLAVAPSFVAAGLIAVLPWALFYSRVMQGAELTFQELLLLAALARLVFAPPAPAPPPGPARPVGWREWLLGSFALAWLLYGYWCTRAMLGMPLVAAALASGRRRLWCVAIAIAGCALYWPYIEANRDSMFISQGVSPRYYANFGALAEVAQRLRQTLVTFVLPAAQDGWLTIRAAAVHPAIVLVLAAVGACTGLRRGVFLWAGFLGGLAPTVLAWDLPSTHRMLMAFPFVALAAACAVALLPRGRARRIAAVAVVGVAGWQGVSYYFSADFWPPETRWKFDGPRTALLESLPLGGDVPIIFERQITFFRDPRRLVSPSDLELVVENWFPSDRGGIYAFSAEALPLRPFYEGLVGPARVEPFGWTFKVTFEPRDWSWLREHGWSYEVRCATQTLRGQVPTLFHPQLSFAALTCSDATVHRWRARWDGPPTPLRLRTSVPTIVQAGAERLTSTGVPETKLDFVAQPGMEIAVEATAPPFQPAIYAGLFERTPAIERLPAWERAVPLFEDGGDPR